VLVYFADWGFWFASETSTDRYAGSNALTSMAMAMAAAFLAPQTQGLDEIIHPETVSPEEAFAQAELLERVRAAIEKRPDNERALLTLIKHASPDIHPALKPLLDKVA